MALRRGLIQRGPFGPDRRDAKLGEAEQLAIIRLGVTVDVAPDLQIAKGGVGLVDRPVAIVVQLTQLGEARSAGRAEHFGDVADLAVAIDVHDEEPVIPRQPSGLLREIITIQIEMRP
jgi:hypothetical protein